MLYYDLDIGAWVNSPGSKSTPQITPVLTVGATYSLDVTFCRGTVIESVLGGTFYGGIKIKNDYSGDTVASDSSPVLDGEEAVVFAIDLTTTEGKAYFTANPTEDTVSAVFVIVATIDTNAFKTAPMELTLQNDYFADQ